jgi:PadR family transcriptional regulator PadR
VPRPPNASPQTRLLLDELLDQPETWHYGYALSQLTGLKSGTLYPLLLRLAECGWLETQWVEAERAGRPPRHLYRLTVEGAKAAASLRWQASMPQPRRGSSARILGGEVGASPI